LHLKFPLFSPQLKISSSQSLFWIFFEALSSIVWCLSMIGPSLILMCCFLCVQIMDMFLSGWQNRIACIKSWIIFSWMPVANIFAAKLSNFDSSASKTFNFVIQVKLIYCSNLLDVAAGKILEKMEKNFLDLVSFVLHRHNIIVQFMKWQSGMIAKRKRVPHFEGIFLFASIHRALFMVKPIKGF